MKGKKRWKQSLLAKKRIIITIVAIILMVLFGFTIYFSVMQNKRELKPSNMLNIEGQEVGKKEGNKKTEIEEKQIGDENKKIESKEGLEVETMPKSKDKIEKLTEDGNNSDSNDNNSKNEITKNKENTINSKVNSSQNNQTNNTKEENPQEIKEVPQSITGDTKVDFEGMIDKIDSRIEENIRETLPEQDFDITIQEPVIPY